MATLEDKILGEKLEYYCSSSEDENDNSDSGKEDGDKQASEQQQASSAPEYIPDPDGSSCNTGPKGVIKDWQRFKQHEQQKRAQMERERLEMIKKLSLTCKSALDEEKDKISETDPELAELLSDEFLFEYQKQRMQEMMAKAEKLVFGKVMNLNSADQLLDAVDKEDKSVTVIVHICADNNEACEAMNGCLITLAEEYPQVKFCKILGSVAGLSKLFKSKGVPALLVYKSGQVVGNFVQLSESLGSDFYASDVETFLIEHGILHDKRCIPPIMNKSRSENRNND